MNFLPEPQAVRFDEECLWVSLDDGRTIGVPLAWYPRLLNGSAADRMDYFLSPSGIHWESLDEDVSVAGLMADRMTSAPVEPKRAA